MRFRLSAAVQRAAIDGGLSASGEDGRLMHVALTRAEDLPPLGPTRLVMVDATPEQWDALALWCRQAARVGPGAPREARRRALACSTAHRRITAELDRLAQHPAYRGLAILGSDPTHFPAYRASVDGRWWPTSRLAHLNGDGGMAQAERTELIPQRVEMPSGRVLTLWVSPEK